MKEKEYKTRQREILLTYLQALEGKHTTISDISLHFASMGEEIGTSTIYRHLNRLVEEGRVKRFTFPGSAAACFQFVKGDCGGHYHMKCEKCGRLVHLDCDEMEQLRGHVLNEHDFEIDLSRVVFYGICGDCRRSA